MRTSRIAAALSALVAMVWASSAAAQTPDTVCRAAQTFAASYFGEWLSLDGAGQIVEYPKKIINAGNVFDTVNFTVPCTGIFTFTVSFVRDADVNTRCTEAGTADDVYIQFWRHPAAGGSDLIIGSSKGAWAGQTPTNVARATGTATVTVALDQSDVVYTKTLSDKGQPICLGVAYFEGHKAGK